SFSSVPAPLRNPTIVQHDSRRPGPNLPSAGPQPPLSCPLASPQLSLSLPSAGPQPPLSCPLASPQLSLSLPSAVS
ncbi:unnamed protein product, partial [Gadus morhua 'NCC']